MNECEDRGDRERKNHMKDVLSFKSKCDINVSGIPSEMQEGPERDFPVLPMAEEL